MLGDCPAQVAIEGSLDTGGMFDSISQGSSALRCRTAEGFRMFTMLRLSE